MTNQWTDMTNQYTDMTNQNRQQVKRAKKDKNSTEDEATFETSYCKDVTL